jgi:hypothetical protein
MNIDHSQAILRLVPNARFQLKENNLSTLNWESDPATRPSDAEIEQSLIDLQAEWTAQEYARNRQAEYPDWGTQLNKIYDDGLTKWKSEMVDPVKSKWPKDNSGPK